MRILIGCWGKMGDIIHTIPVAQKLANDVSNSVHLVYSPSFASASGAIDLLNAAFTHSAVECNFAADDLGADPAAWDWIMNCSPGGGTRPDPLRGWTIFSWWGNGCHSIDFAAGYAILTLTGNERYLNFKREVMETPRTNTVAFLSNCADPAARGMPAHILQEFGNYVLAKGAEPVEISIGAICIGTDRRGMSMSDVICHIAASKLLISVDTMASGLIAQSLGIPIIRLYTGITRDSMTGVTDPAYPASRAEINDGYLTDKVITHIDALWDWRERGTD